jgi:FixJ family two-component response regulator
MVKAALASSPLISVVDDDTVVGEALRDLIVSMGYNAIAFGSAEEFLSSATMLQTACLVSNGQMPGLSGLDLQARMIANGHHIPIIFVTAHGDEKTSSRIRAEQATFNQTGKSE